MSGPELCWQTRILARSGRPLYIILMSSTDDRRNLIKALDSGADDFISKPPLAEELSARLRAAGRVISTQRELYRNATTDSLTGLLNRRAFFGSAKEICARAEAGVALSAIMVDVDHFKRINDNYGHGAGDVVLQALAQDLSKEEATVGRLGGEEFAMLLEGASLSAAVKAADRVRLRLQDLEVHTKEKTISMTCSFGVSQWQLGDTIDCMLRRADVALYEAKRGGRNCVVSTSSNALTADYSVENSIVRSRTG